MSCNYLMTGMYLALQFDFRDDGMDGGAKSKKKWTTLEHHGIKFPPLYQKHNIPIIYNGEKIILDSDSEESATLFSRFIESEYVKSNIFRKNFWNDWKKILGPDHVIKDLAGCDFTLIYEYLLRTKEEKKTVISNKKIETTEIIDPDAKYKIALVDGKPQNVGNFSMEPPGIFLGRGCNKNLGRLKKRIQPEDVTINIGKNTKIPESLPGHQWGDIVHNQYAEWLASWKDSITGKTKYMWLASHSDFKTNSDIEKFDMARKLKRKIKTIRAQNEIELKSPDKKMRQMATVLYFIDQYALRIGNEKGDDTETFGVTSLLVKHMELLGNDQIKLDFLGKDSIRYNRILNMSHIVYNNIEEFLLNKEPADPVFDLVTAVDINKYLQTYMKNLSARVFRTFNASNLFQKELHKISNKFETYEESDKINLILTEFTKANGKVALLCNHQKGIAKSNATKIENLNQSIKKLKAKIRKATASNKKNPVKINEMKNKLKILRSKKDMAIELKNISLDTSKANYIDPRITVAFLKKNNVPIDKLFSRVLVEKFKWAFDVDENYKF